MKRCQKCAKEWVSEKRQPGVKEFCPACSAYLHCCLNCRFRDKSVHNECRIPTTEWVGDRAGCNFCDEFEFADTAPGKSSGKTGTAVPDAFEQLFGDADDGPKKGLDDFKKLFGD